MSDPGSISDLDKNRSLAAWLEWQLRQTRNRIRELKIQEQQEQQEQRRRERARAEQSWKIQPKRTGDTAMLHRGACTLCADMGFINREEAIIALAEPDIEACQICHPETGLTEYGPQSSE